MTSDDYFCVKINPDTELEQRVFSVPPVQGDS